MDCYRRDLIVDGDFVFENLPIGIIRGTNVVVFKLFIHEINFSVLFYDDYFSILLET